MAQPRPLADQLTDELGVPLEGMPAPGINVPGGFNAADQDSINEKRRADGRRRRNQADALRKAMHDPAFREYMWDTMVACHAFADCRGPTPEDTYFALGERQFGLRLHEDICAASLDLYLTMRKEAMEREKRANGTKGDDE